MEWVAVIPPSLAAIATAVWAVWKWSKEREQSRITERNKLAALYVNPFLSACEDLQSRLYNILEMGGLGVLRERYSARTYPEETLYLIVRYFGWEGCIYRYGPYTKDSEVIRLTEAVRNAFASSRFKELGAFCFFRHEQRALGQLVIKRIEGGFGVEFDTISLYEFGKQLDSQLFSGMESVKQTLEGLRNATDVDSLPGRDRLTQVQNYLVDLLSYMEELEGFSLFPGQRKKARLNSS